MATIADLSGDEREERAAELKRKMQEAAKKRAVEREEEASPADTNTDTEAGAEAEVAAVSAPVAAAAAAQQPEAVATAVESVEPTAAAGETPPPTSGNGAAVAAAPAPTAVIAEPPPAIGAPPALDDEQVDPEAVARAEMNRREFLAYTWGAALGLLTLQSGVASYFFLYPRFRAGEFGGDFFKPLADFGDPASAPAGDTKGKFWMVTIKDGDPKALYMVCPHLGCLYKWVEANHRFECPCHGSKYTHDGYYIEGPAPRSLDYFELDVEGDNVVVHTGKKILGIPSAESPARAVPI